MRAPRKGSHAEGDTAPGAWLRLDTRGLLPL